MLKRLQCVEREQALASLQGWSTLAGRDAIAKRYEFADFNGAFGFMTRVALLAESTNHHPEWSNVYGRVDVVLSFHAADGLTLLDIEFAKSMDRLLEPAATM